MLKYKIQRIKFYWPGQRKERYRYHDPADYCSDSGRYLYDIVLIPKPSQAYENNTKGYVCQCKNRNGEILSIAFQCIYPMKIDLIEGRDFEIEFTSDSSAVIVNQKLVDELDLDQPIGKTFTIGPNPPVTIIGVVNNFNYSSLKEEVGAAALNMDPKLGLFYAVVRISVENMTDTISFLEKRWKEIQPLRPFTYSFLDDDIRLFYSNDLRFLRQF